jgi:DNA-binding response OmpR family regulator
MYAKTRAADRRASAIRTGKVTVADILVVEDDPIIRQTVDYALRRAGFSTRTSGDGVEALRMARETSPDLILLDLMLPGIDGFEFADQIRRSDPDVAIVMVTALSEERDTVRGLDAGADDYVTKPFSMEELLARVRANLRRVRERAVLDTHATIEAGDLVIEPRQLRVEVAGVPIRLRLKEFQLLLALAKAPGQLMTRQKLAQEVWGYDHLASSRTIDVHIRRVRQAIEERSGYTYVQTVHGVGYRFEAQPKGAS